MSDSRELLDKADALLGRYRGESKREDDGGFPVLTDVVEASTEAPNPAAASLMELAGLERRLGERLEASLLPLSGTALEERLLERLEERLRPLLQESVQEVRLEMEARMRDEISGAVRDALAELRASLERSS